MARACEMARLSDSHCVSFASVDERRTCVYALSVASSYQYYLLYEIPCRLPPACASLCFQNIMCVNCGMESV